MTKEEMAEVFDLSKGIKTRSGLWVDLFNINPENFNIHDIAWALSMNCRFNGHTKVFYSVAEHSIWVAEHSKDKFAGLMHDSSEAYLTDIPSPFKQYMPEYKNIESTAMAALSERFGFTWPLPKDVKEADYLALGYEWENFMLKHNKALPQHQAYELFLIKYYDYHRKK